ASKRSSAPVLLVDFVLRQHWPVHVSSMNVSPTGLNNSTKQQTSLPYLLSSEDQHSSFLATSSLLMNPTHRKLLPARPKKSNAAQWKRFSPLSASLDEKQSKCREITLVMISALPTVKATSTT